MFFIGFELNGDLNVLIEQKRRLDEEIMKTSHNLTSLTEKNYQFQLKVICLKILIIEK